MIETKTAAIQLALQRRATIAMHELQRFAQSATPITAKQAASIDAACTALDEALTAAGFGSAGLAAGEGVVVDNRTYPLNNFSGGALSAQVTAKIMAGELKEVRLPNNMAVATSMATVPAEGTGTTATIVVASGKITKVTLA